MTFSTRSRRPRWGIVLPGLSLLALGSGLGLHGMTSAQSQPSPAPARAATVDPGLILHRHAVRISGTLGSGVSLEGTLSPSLPGLNTVSLRILLPGGQRAR